MPCGWELHSGLHGWVSEVSCMTLAGRPASSLNQAEKVKEDPLAGRGRVHRGSQSSARGAAAATRLHNAVLLRGCMSSKNNRLQGEQQIKSGANHGRLTTWPSFPFPPPVKPLITRVFGFLATQGSFELRGCLSRRHAFRWRRPRLPPQPFQQEHAWHKALHLKTPKRQKRESLIEEFCDFCQSTLPWTEVSLVRQSEPNSGLDSGMSSTPQVLVCTVAFS